MGIWKNSLTPDKQKQQKEIQHGKWRVFEGTCFSAIWDCIKTFRSPDLLHKLHNQAQYSKSIPLSVSRNIEVFGPTFTVTVTVNASTLAIRLSRFCCEARPSLAFLLMISNWTTDSLVNIRAATYRHLVDIQKDVNIKL